MNNFQIETAQNVSISQNAAGVGERILAYIIDGAVMLTYIFLSGSLMDAMGLNQGERWVYFLIIGLPPFLYFLLWEIFWNGQTPGKAALNLRVVKLDGSKPGLSDFLIRWLLRIIDITLTSGSVAIVSILLNGRGQRLGDLAAGTTVIQEKSEVGFDQILLVDLPKEYQPKYPQVRVLTDKDVQEIKNLYQDALKFSNHKIINSLSAKVSEILEVTPQETPIEFLGTVLKDYNYYTQQ